MNTNTGQLYDLSDDLFAAEPEPTVFLELDTLTDRLAVLEREATADEKAMLADLERGDTVVAVSPQVAHTVRLGQREQDRRKRRRQQARASRRRNR